MNFLAHVALVDAPPAVWMGNFMGDFVRGRLETSDLPPEIVRGVRLHRAIDCYTDAHPEVVAARRRVSPERGRFAGIILDVAFDHYLIRHWSRYHAEPFDAFVDRAYATMQTHAHVAPADLQALIPRIVEYDWFRGYRELSGIGYALDRIARRFSRPTTLPGALDELRQHDATFEAHFLAFYPDLIAHVAASSAAAGPTAPPAAPPTPGA